MKTRKEFIWKRQVVLRDKKGGGMGVRNPKLNNKSLLVKWLWRYYMERNEVLEGAEMLFMVKKKDGEIIKRGVWKNISKLWGEFNQFTRLGVDDGIKN